MAFRMKKTTKAQYESLLDFVSINKILITGKSKPSDYCNVSDLWKNFAMQENAKGCGPMKTADQWKKIFNEWKMNTKRKSREIHVSLIKTGGGSCSSKKLSDLEERLLNLLSKIHLGDDTIPDTLGGCSSSATVAEFMPNNPSNPNNAEASSTNIESTNTFVLNFDIQNENEDSIEIISLLPDHEVNEDVDDPQPFAVASTRELGDNRQEVQKNTRDKSNNKKKIAAPAAGSSRYTAHTLQTACSVFAETQNTLLETEHTKADAIQQLASSVDNFAAAVREKTSENFKLERAKLKLEYYKVFGSFENFENLFE